MKKLIRVTTVAMSLHNLLRGQLKFLDEYYEVIAIASDDGFLPRVTSNEGIKVKEIKMTRQITLFKDIKALWIMFLFFHTEKPLIVHTHTPKAGIVGMMAAWLARVPLRLHTVAGLPLMETSGIKRRLLNLVEYGTYKFATRVYPNSHGLRDFIISERLCSPEKLKVIGSGSSNGIDTKYFDPSFYTGKTKESLRRSYKIQQHDFVFIFIGRLVKHKGVNELISAFRNLAWDNCKLLLVGPYEEDLDPLPPDTLNEIESNPKIITTGYVNDVRPYLAVSNALVFPSYREGFPNVVMQAGAMGLPSIVSDINGCNEIIQNRVNGLIVPAKEIDELHSAMQTLLNDQELVEALAANARPLIVTRYEQKVVWQAILDEYRGFEDEYNHRLVE